MLFSIARIKNCSRKLTFSLSLSKSVMVSSGNSSAPSDALVSIICCESGTPVLPLLLAWEEVGLRRDNRLTNSSHNHKIEGDSHLYKNNHQSWEYLKTDVSRLTQYVYYAPTEYTPHSFAGKQLQNFHSIFLVRGMIFDAQIPHAIQHNILSLAKASCSDGKSCLLTMMYHLYFRQHRLRILSCTSTTN